MSFPKSILITGANGFVGRNLYRYFSRLTSVIGTGLTPDRTPTTPEPFLSMDVRDPARVLEVLKERNPEAVLHVAGNKNVKACQQSPQEAHRTNAEGTQNVARACRRIGAHLVYLSTDLVFDCRRGNYTETDAPGADLVYGQTKLEGERFALLEHPDVAICRSAGIYGKTSPLLLWLQKELLSGKTVSCFTDVCNTPTYADNLAEMLQAVLARRHSGIFHTVGRDRVNRFEFFQSFARHFHLPVQLLKPHTAGDERDALLLQPDSSLNSEKTVARLGVAADSLDDGFTKLQASGGL